MPEVLEDQETEVARLRELACEFCAAIEQVRSLKARHTRGRELSSGEHTWRACVTPVQSANEAMAAE